MFYKKNSHQHFWSNSNFYPLFLKIRNFEKNFQPLQDFQDYNFEEQYTINLSAIRFALPDSLTQTVIYDTLQKRKLYVR